MSFTLSGFGALQYQASPQIFQALSLGGATPLPPQPAFGTPNQNLVPVTQAAHGATVNLSLQAAPVADAIQAVSVSKPALNGATALSTAFAGARNGNVLIASGPPGTLDGVYGGIPPEGAVAFGVRAPIFNGTALLSHAQPSTVAKIVSTIKNLAIAALYPQPIFSFKA